MVKLIFLCTRRPDVTHEHYTKLLLEGHVPLALKHHPTMRHYTVNIVERSPAGWDELDSVGELYFDTLDDFRQRLYDSAEGEKIIHRDVAGFMGGAFSYATMEHVQRPAQGSSALGRRTPGVKLVCPLVRRDGMSHDEFVDHWLEQHVPLALRHHPHMTRYVTNVVHQRFSALGPELDGIAELHFPAAEIVDGGMFDSPEGERIVRQDIARFIGKVAPYHVAEYRQK